MMSLHCLMHMMYPLSHEGGKECSGVKFNRHLETWAQNWQHNWDKFWDTFSTRARTLQVKACVKTPNMTWARFRA